MKNNTKAFGIFINNNNKNNNDKLPQASQLVF